MKTFKILISEIFDIKNITSENIETPKETKIPNVSLSRTYKSKIGDNEIITKIDHSFITDKSDIKFFVNGNLEKTKNQNTSEALKTYEVVLKHIKHHMDNPPGEIKAIKYSYKDDKEGNKKHKIYQQFGKKFNIELEPRIA